MPLALCETALSWRAPVLRSARLENTAMEQDRPPRVLAVSNDHRFLSLLRSILAETGLEPCTLDTWGSVVQQAEHVRPHLILLDLNVTHATPCAKTLRQVRAHPVVAEIPIVVCPTVAWLVDEHAAELRQPGIWLWEAPFDPSALLVTVQAALRPRPLRLWSPY
jgi:DNA-binding response OmpR family regulator